MLFAKPVQLIREQAGGKPVTILQITLKYVTKIIKEVCKIFYL